MIRHKVFAGLVLLSLTLLGGCFLVSAQMTIVYKAGDGAGMANQTVYSYHVDLNDNDDYEEHHDKIKNVEAFGFDVTITNQTANTASAEGYISFSEVVSPSVENIRTQATQVFSGIPLQPNETRAITYDDSQRYIERIDVIDEAIREGIVWFYVITDQGIRISSTGLTLVMTVNLEA
ncbi:MAG: hypothetical protein MUE60_15975 [Candidatus Eisenbacteria bacterium]|jgi:hypothetical protein|nr:hypothetical protein [Candidatus Eisenbacteria bacterium]